MQTMDGCNIKNIDERDRFITNRLIDDGSSRYTRSNIESWLTNWLDYFDTDDADRRLSWAMVKSDLEIAIAKQPDYMQDVFILVGVEQLSFSAAADELGISDCICMDLWNMFVGNVTWQLRDKRIHEPEEYATQSRKRMNFIPQTYIHTLEGFFDSPCKP